jgi:hypothetical protein
LYQKTLLRRGVFAFKALLSNLLCFSAWKGQLVWSWAKLPNQVAERSHREIPNSQEHFFAENLLVFVVNLLDMM